MTVVNNGRRYLVNVATDDGIGGGFAAGQLVMKSSDGQWYIVTASGSAGSIATSVNQTPLSYITGSDGTNYYDQNFPYQLLASSDGNAYAVFLDGTAPTATLTVSQSAYGKAYITNSLGAVFDIAKPYLLLQNVSNGDYYYAGLGTSGGTTTLSVNQYGVSQSLVNPVY
jgi:hypothetical protein